MNYLRRPEDNKCYFMTTCDGKPMKIQRTIFSECFYIMAMAGLYQATKEKIYKVKQNGETFCKVLRFSKTLQKD